MGLPLSPVRLPGTPELLCSSIQAFIWRDGTLLIRPAYLFPLVSFVLFLLGLV